MPSHFLHTEADLHKALLKLTKADPRLKPVLAKAGRPSLRRRPAGFPGLCAIVVSQQLSTASAGAIWRR
jgi:DNA-3-methyladenine glycosylase II